MENQRNLIAAVVISLVVLLGFQWYESKFHPAAPPQPNANTTAVPSANNANPSAAAPSLSPPTGPAANATASAGAPPTASPRVQIETSSLKGSLALRGARLDDLELLKYREEIDPKSPAIRLLDPTRGVGAYFAEFGWVSQTAGVKTPDSDTLWTSSADKLTPQSPITLTWDNGQGVKFERSIAIDDDYMFSITDKVANSTSQPLSLRPYGLVARGGTPPSLGTYIVHEGNIGVLNGSLTDAPAWMWSTQMYKRLKEDPQLRDCGAEQCHGEAFTSKGGWIGFTDKYWLTAFVPDQAQDGNWRMSWNGVDNIDHYQSDWTGAAETVAAGATLTQASHFFAGAEVLDLLDRYGDEYKIPKFGLAIDFGQFWFLTIPFYKFLLWIHSHVANFGIAILIFTVVIRGAFFPIANRSFQMMNRMRMLQPEVKKLQERYADDRAKMNQEVMALYRKEKANPMAGCLPIALQIPVFFALYKVLYVTIDMRQAPFFGWIHDLSQPDPTWLITAFGLVHWDVPSFLSFLQIGIWPLIMGVTLFAQQKFNPQPTDPTQAKIFAFMPIIFTFMLGRFPAGLVIYWSWSNTLSILQQWIIRRRMNRPKPPVSAKA